MSRIEPLSQPALVRIGKNVRRIRGERSQREFCDLTGLSQTTLSRIENADHPGLDIDCVVTIAVRAGVAIDDVLYAIEDSMGSIRERDRLERQQAAA